MLFPPSHDGSSAQVRTVEKNEIERDSLGFAHSHTTTIFNLFQVDFALYSPMAFRLQRAPLSRGEGEGTSADLGS